MLKINGNKTEIKTSDKGNFLLVESEKSEEVFEIGMLSFDKFSAAFRNNACWMVSKSGTEINDIPEETQFLLTCDGKNYLLIFALVDGFARAAIFGENDKLFVRIETGDSKQKIEKIKALYFIEGENPYELVKEAYKEIQNELKTFLLKKDKEPPQFLELFGFCTYNAFYENVTHNNIINLVDDFKKHNCQIGFIIADAGWQTYRENRVFSFEADINKFPYGLKNTVNLLKEKYGVKKFFCWHTYNGYWLGLDKEGFPDYKINMEIFKIPKRFENSIFENEKIDTAGQDFYPSNIINKECGFFGDDLYLLYRDFYKALKAENVDGAKLDAMCWIEAFGENKGGRVFMMRQLVSGLEKASQEYFNGEHINCSSCSNDFFYNINSGGVTRTSCDYFPDDKKSHGRHIATNSIMGFWLDELLFCDWDIFQSGNIAGEFHAMSRAISGGPVYCTDDLKTVNYPLLQKLSTSDGRVGRCLDNAKITRNCLFSDIENNPLIRVFNRNRYGYVLAAFNCSEKTEISEKIFLNEIENLPEKVYAVYSTKKGFLGIKNSLDFVETSLKGYEGEIFQLAPVNKGIAVLGLIDKFNSIGFIVNINYANNEISVETMEKGNILIYSDKEIITDSKYAKQGNMYLFNDCNIILLQQQKML